MPRDKANTNAGVQFTRSAAKEIAETVRIVRGGDRKQPGMGGRNAPYSSSHYLSKTTETWAKGTSQTLTLYVGTPGSETATGESVAAWNKWGDVAADQWVVLARANGSFYLTKGPDVGIKRGTFSAPWSKGSSASVTDALASGTTYSVKNYFANITGTGTKNCAFAYVGTEWILIAAEC